MLSKNPKIKYFSHNSQRLYFLLKRYLIQGRASGMDCTLHTDLRESETSRDIKK